MPITTHSPAARATLVAYGHSWVDGDGASSRAAGFAALAARELGLILDNRGVGGSGSSATAELVASDPPPAAVLYVVMTGLNDLRLHGEDPAALNMYAAALRRILRTLQRTAPQSAVLILAQPHLVEFGLHAPHNRGSNQLIERYNAVLKQCAAEYPQALVVEADGWDARRMLDDDTVHPNDAGHACLARAVVRAAATMQQPAR
jgi:lysophospholipase L1-like esterase